MATENKQINHPVATGAALDAGHHQGLFGYDTTTGKCRFQFGPLLANTKQLMNVGDAPTAHKSSHEYGGSDALVGQNIAGLRTSDSPNFATSVVSGVTRISAGGTATVTGFTSSGGGTFTGAKTSFATGVAGYAGLNIGGTGVAPTTPADGDYWRLGDGVQVQLGANTRTFMLSETTQTISGAKTFSALGTFNLGLTVNGAKTTVAAATAPYASLNIPTRSAATTSPATGDIDSNGTDLEVYLLGIKSIKAASDSVGFGSAWSLDDAQTKTKAWAGQLGVNNTLDFWNYASGSWGSAPRHRMSANGFVVAAGASDTVGSGSSLGLYDALTGSAKAWSLQLGNTNGVIDYWYWNGTAWAKKVQFSNAGGVGFFGTAAPTSKPAVTGSRGGNAALASLLTTLAACGLITDSTTA